ncbi:MAG: arylsulfatase [Planctomycetota bacterium]
MPDAPNRPNIILILADDMGYSDIGCYGGEINTPNLDALARGGMRFSQVYNCARCCPTRASILTGLYPHKAGIGHMVRDLGHPSYRGFLSERSVTLAEALRPAGYRSMLSGKWHVGGLWPRRPGVEWRLDDPRKPLPLDRGFDRFYGCPGGGSYYFVSPLISDEHYEEVPEGFYTSDNYTTEAIRFIEQCDRSGEPFFVHLTYNAPHWPLHAPRADIEKYRGQYQKGWDAVRAARHERLKGDGVLSADWAISARDADAPPWENVPDHDWEDARMATYAAMVDRMDQNIGRLRASLRQLGIEDNTLILFLSDNGGSAEFLRENGRKERELPFTRTGQPVMVGNFRGLEPGGPETFMSYDLPWANVSNSPFRRFKSWVHEGGISTPLIAHWPERITTGGGLSHQTAHVVDIYATILDVAGAEYPESRNGKPTHSMDGESFLPLLTGGDWSRSGPLFWEHEGNAAVRDGRWKLVRQEGQPWELYDMISDRTERNNLADQDAGRVAAMAEQWDAWSRACGVLPWEQVRAAMR